MAVPLVSIIISAYDHLASLPVTLNSLLQQSYQAYEVLIFADDCQVMRACLDSWVDPRFSLISQNDLGLGATLNQGVLQAQGKYIAFIRPGDSWHPSKLQKQVNLLERHPEVSFVNSWLRLLDHQGELTDKIIRQQDLWSCDDHYPIALSAVMLRRNCFNVTKMFDVRLQALPDWELWLRLSLHYQFTTLAQPLVYCQDCLARVGENWLVAETDLQTTIEKTCANTINKNHYYAQANLFVAEKILHSKNPELAIILNYCRQALEHDPLAGLSWRFFRLRWSIVILSWRQNNFYRLCRLVLTTIIKWLQVVWSRFGESSHKLLEWMLEEEVVSFGNGNNIKQQTKD